MAPFKAMSCFQDLIDRRPVWPVIAQISGTVQPASASMMTAVSRVPMNQVSAEGSPAGQTSTASGPIDGADCATAARISVRVL